MDPRVAEIAKPINSEGLRFVVFEFTSSVSNINKNKSIRVDVLLKWDE